MNTQICTKCGEEKPLSKFTFFKNDGTWRKQCHDCKTVMMREYRAEHREHTNALACASHKRARQRRPKSFMVYRAKVRARQLGVPFGLTEDDIFIPEVCPILGIKLLNPIDGIGMDTGQDACPSLDRVIPELGYVKANVRVISKRANTIKSFGTKEEHQKVIEYIEQCESENDGYLKKIASGKTSRTLVLASDLNEDDARQNTCTELSAVKAQ